MIHDVGDLFGEQPNVQGVQHTARTWSGKVELEVPRGVPGKGGDTTVGTNSKIVENATEATRALGPLAIGLPLDPHSRRSHNFFLRKQLLGPIKEIGEDEWTVLHKTLHH
jgi:hypothetical protein